MAIIATKKQNSEPIPEGAYPTRIYQILHIGTVPGFQGALQNKVRITFEFPTEKRVFDKDKGEQPMVLSQDYTLSMHEKSGLRKLIDACDPKALKANDDGFIDEYDVKNLLGKACLVTVIHKEAKTGEAVYANVGAVTMIPKGMECPPQINESKSLDYENFDFEYFKTLPQFIQDRIKSSQEYQFMTIDKTDETPPFAGNGQVEDDGLEHIKDEV